MERIGRRDGAPDAYEGGRSPDPRCVSYTHDRDYGSFKPYTADFTSGLVSPEGAEYGVPTDRGGAH